jgi:succinate-acetate transporter protein
VSYGVFWITLVGLIVGPRTGWVDRTPEGFMGCFLVMWGIFTLFMFFGTLRSNRALQFVFGSLTVLFCLLAIRDFAESPVIGTIAGWEGILCGASAIYLAMAEVLSEQFGRDVLPIGRPKAAVITSVPSSLPAVASGAG